MRRLSKFTASFQQEFRHLRVRNAGLSALLVVQTFLSFVAVPLVGAGMISFHVLDIGRGAFVVACVVALTGKRGHQAATVLALLAAAAAPAVWSRLGPHLGFRGTTPRNTVPLTIFIFNVFITYLVARLTFEKGRVTGHRIQGAIVVYLNVATLFAIVFDMLEARLPGAIKSSTGALIPAELGPRIAELSYFSLSTVTTCGFGDLMPVHPIARSLANFEAGFGQLFLAIFLARLVAMHLSEDERRQPAPH